jgi:hypothetical protein
MKGARGNGFLPTQVNGCVLWLRADQGITFGSGSLGVQAWADLSGNGNDFSNATLANQPNWLPSSTINGQPAVQGNGTSSFLQATKFTDKIMSGTLAAKTLNTTPSAAERIMVARSANDPSSGFESGLESVFQQYWCGGGGDAGSLLPYTDGNIYDNFGSTTRPAMSGHPAGGCASPFIYDSYSAASDWRAYFNGNPTPFFTTNSNTVAFFNNVAPFLFSWTTFYSTMTIAEWIVYNRVLGTDERKAVSGYLGSRYAIQVTP